MIIFLYGSDSYRSKQKLNEIIERYKKINQTTLNLKIFNFKEIDFENFEKEIQSDSIFKKKKLIVLKNIFLNKELQENFLNYFKKLVKEKRSEIILLYEQDLFEKKNSALFKFLQKYGNCQEFKPLDGQKLKNWVKEEFKKYQTQIDSIAIEQIINFVGNDLWRFSNEIKKLSIFKKKINNNQIDEKMNRIERKDIELLIKPKIEVDIFKTIDALANKRKKQALLLLTKHIEKGDSPLYLLSMISYQFRNLLIIKDFLEKKKFYKEIVNISGLHPYVVKKTIAQAKGFSLEKLKKIFQKIFQIDINIKTGQIEPQIALNSLIAEI